MSKDAGKDADLVLGQSFVKRNKNSEFFERIFGRNCFGGNFQEEIFERIFSGIFWEFFGRIFWEELFWEELFWRNSLFRKELICWSRFWFISRFWFLVKILS